MSASAAAVIVIKEKHIVAAFRRAGATSAGTAVAPETIGVLRRLVFAKLVRRAVLRESGQGRFYLDEQKWEAVRRLRHRLALGVLLAVAVVFAGYALLHH